MATKRVLFISGSIGLGHIGRDLAIARALRVVLPGVEMAWIAAPPADRVLQEAGEPLLPEAAEYVDETAIAEGSARGGRLSLVRYAFKARKTWSRNIDVVRRVTRREHFDLVIGDETYEVSLAYKHEPELKTCPFVMIYDFVGFDAVSWNPVERLGGYLWNRAWAAGYRRATSHVDLGIFIGDELDVPDRRFGFLLPNRREWARRRCHFVGQVFAFDPSHYADRAELRARLGYGPEPLVVCSIGGTRIGTPLLELCGRAYPLMREKVPDLRMVLIAGPRAAKKDLTVPAGVEVRGYVPALHEHFAAADLAVVQAGGTTTMELAALRRPFIYFPIEGHAEQEVHVAARLARIGAGVRLSLSRTPPQILASVALAELGTSPVYPPVRTDGAERAAELIRQLLIRPGPARS